MRLPKWLGCTLVATLAAVILLPPPPPSFAQDQTTPNLGLTLPAPGSSGWDTKVNNNFTILDSQWNGSAAIAVPKVCNGTDKFSGFDANGVFTCTPDESGSAISGPFSLTGDLTPAQIVADQDNYNPAGLASASLLRLSTDASHELRGIQTGTDGRLLPIYNVGSFDIVLKNLAGTSAAANQLSINADITLAANQGIILQYDATSTKWRAASGVSGAGGQAADNDLSAIAAFAGTGYAVRTAGDTWAQRQITSANANNIIITNPAAIAGNTAVDVGPNVALTTRSFSVTAGDWDFGSAASLTFPHSAGAAPGAKRCAIDDTAVRMKCNFGSGVVTLAITSEIQPLSANLTALSGIVGANNVATVFTGAGTMVAYTKPSCNGAGQAVNWDAATHTESCVTFSGGLSGMTPGKLQKSLTPTTIGDTVISEAGGTVTVGGGLVVGATPFLIFDTSAIAASDKTWTILNVSGTMHPSTGVLTPGNVVTTNAAGQFVDGGAAGAGTWTDASANTGDNKILVATGAGGTNTLTIPISASFDGGSLTPDGTNCNDPTKVTINSGPTQYVIVCSTAAAAQFDAVLVGLKQAVGTFTVSLTVNDVDSAAQHFAGTFKAQCRAHGAAPSSTWGATQTVDITMTTANVNYVGTTAAITANGACSAGTTLYLRFDANGSMTDDGDARVIGLVINQAS